MLLLAMLASAVLGANTTHIEADTMASKAKIVEIHNVERAKVGSPPLTWSDDLARDAAVWADRLAMSGSFDHDPSRHGQGENLSMGTSGAYSLVDMIGGWVEEKADLRTMRSWEDDYHKVGHYTQMVWKDTRSVGCAVSRNRFDEYLVCRYDPAGNVMGESPFVDGR